MGRPAGLAERLQSQRYGAHFELYAAAERGGYHIEDLRALAPTPDEIETAARWAMTHDVSEGFVMVLNTERSVEEPGVCKIC